MNLSTLPAVGQPHAPTVDPELVGIFAGVITLPDSTHHAVILLDDKPADELTWKKAMNWAEKLGAQLPSRPIAAMLYANLKAQFTPEWHWTNEAYDSSCAWVTGFGNGLQSIYGESAELRARAVRLIQLVA